MHINAVFLLASMDMEAFEQTLSLQKDGDVSFVKTPVIGTFVNELNRNEILQPNILIYFKTIFNVMKRTLLVRRGGDGGF